MRGNAEALRSAPAYRARRLGTGLQVLRDALAARGVLDERVSAELDAGRLYWALERRICAALGRGAVPDAADVAACHEAKSFDYRALHCVLHRLLRAPYDDQLLAFLRLDELLEDVGDDLTDYEDDVCANSFNIYRRVPQLLLRMRRSVVNSDSRCAQVLYRAARPAGGAAAAGGLRVAPGGGARGGAERTAGGGTPALLGAPCRRLRRSGRRPVGDPAAHRARRGAGVSRTSRRSRGSRHARRR